MKNYINSYLDGIEYPPISIEFYDGKYIDWFGIIPTKEFWVGFEQDSLVLLEEADHLLFKFPLTNLKKQRPDIYTIGIIHTNYPYYWKKRFAWIPSWVYWQFFIKKFYGPIISKILHRNCHEIIRLSKVIDFYAPIKTELLHGVSRSFHHKTPPSSGTGIYFIGKLIKEKGIDDFLKIAFRNPSLDFFVFGKSYENSLPPLPSNLTTMGETECPWEDLRKYSIFFNPSKSEVLCTTTLEAIAMNKHVIIPDVLCNSPFKPFPNVYLYNNLSEAEQLIIDLNTKNNFVSPERETLTWENVIRNFVNKTDKKSEAI